MLNYDILDFECGEERTSFTIKCVFLFFYPLSTFSPEIMLIALRLVHRFRGFYVVEICISSRCTGVFIFFDIRCGFLNNWEKSTVFVIFDIVVDEIQIKNNRKDPEFPLILARSRRGVIFNSSTAIA